MCRAKKTQNKVSSCKCQYVLWEDRILLSFLAMWEMMKRIEGEIKRQTDRQIDRDRERERKGVHTE